MRKSLFGINMTTRFSDTDKPFDSTQGHEHCPMASLSLSLIRVVTVPRLRLWTQALPEIPSRILIWIRAVAPNLFHNPLEKESTDLKCNVRTFRGAIRKRCKLKTAIENG